MSSPIIKHFFFSLVAVVHTAEYEPISWHRVQGAFIPNGATAERCIMVMCPLKKVVAPWRKKQTKEPARSWAFWAYGCLEDDEESG